MTSDIRIAARPSPAAAILVATASAIAIRAGTTVEIDGKPFAFESETPVSLGELVAGKDYGVGIDALGGVFASALSDNPLSGPWIGGFHFAPGGNASERSGGDSTPAINPYSVWDRDFRPACPDPRGMTLVDAKDGHHFWADIYLLGVDHKENGTSRYGVEIADGRSLPRLDFKIASEIVADHGKRLLTYDEFRTAAFGVTERSSADGDPKKTGLDAARTSKFGLMQASGNLWVWGTDGHPDDPRPSIFGGAWFDGSLSGSRFARLGGWGVDSYGVISARGASDHLNPA